MCLSLSLPLSLSLAQRETPFGPERSRVWVWKMFQACLSSWACNRRATVEKYDWKIHINKIECVFSGLHWLLMSVFSKKMLCIFIYIYNYIHMYISILFIYVLYIYMNMMTTIWYRANIHLFVDTIDAWPSKATDAWPPLSQWFDHGHGQCQAMARGLALLFFLELGWRESMFGWWCCSFIWTLIGNDWYLIGYSGIVIFLTLIFR